ncbi:hypothetical protein PIB30_095423 [Stylosanthes scabra]|uniref:Uncharacterized protein n=1 Tax=Stylosanthes scabra TaxID=79078 RepID=A0ABU6VU57_9FABA|nr:hypothetical protein [Stylosanthes scabra]
MRILSIRNETDQILGIFVSRKTRALNMVMRILSIRNETDQILGIFVSRKTRALNMGMLALIVWVFPLEMPWIGCEFLGIKTLSNHTCGLTFGSTVRLSQWKSRKEWIGFSFS